MNPLTKFPYPRFSEGRIITGVAINHSPLTSQREIVPSIEEDYEAYIDISMAVFTACERKSIKSLKDFLSILPSPKLIEQVLAVAIYRLAETEADACRWVFRHYSDLMPELDIVEIMTKIVVSTLENHGFTADRDFRWDDNNRLYLSQEAKEGLLVKHSDCARRVCSSCYCSSQAVSSKIIVIFLEEVLDYSIL